MALLQSPRALPRARAVVNCILIGRLGAARASLSPRGGKRWEGLKGWRQIDRGASNGGLMSVAYVAMAVGGIYREFTVFMDTKDNLSPAHITYAFCARSEID